MRRCQRGRPSSVKDRKKGRVVLPHALYLVTSRVRSRGAKPHFIHVRALARAAVRSTRARSGKADPLVAHGGDVVAMTLTRARGGIRQVVRHHLWAQCCTTCSRDLEGAYGRGSHQGCASERPVARPAGASERAAPRNIGEPVVVSCHLLPQVCESSSVSVVVLSIKARQATAALLGTPLQESLLRPQGGRRWYAT